MKPEEFDIDALIGKSLTGEITAEERRTLDSWLAAEEPNRVHYGQMKVLLEKTTSLRDLQAFDTDEAWLRMKEQIRKQKEASGQRYWINNYWRIAAAFLIAIGLAYFSYTRLIKTRDTVQLATQTKTHAEVLPDGTKAFLNKTTRLDYSYNPIKKRRLVKLEGEAHFEIKPAQNKSFMIQSGEVTIEDIGTVFNVDAYPDKSLIRVFVESGEVAIYTDTNPGIRLTKGETGIYNKDSGKFAKLNSHDENVLSYETGIFVFHDTRLEDVVNALNEVYDRKLRLENTQLNYCRITVTFRDEKIEMIADVIAETLKLTTKQSDNEIILNGNGCNN